MPAPLQSRNTHLQCTMWLRKEINSTTASDIIGYLPSKAIILRAYTYIDIPFEVKTIKTMAEPKPPLDLIKINLLLNGTKIGEAPLDKNGLHEINLSTELEVAFDNNNCEIMFKLDKPNPTCGRASLIIEFITNR